MHSTIHAVCGQQIGQNRAKTLCDRYFYKKKKKISQKGRASFRLFQKGRASRKGAEGRALQKKPRQNTEVQSALSCPTDWILRCINRVFVKSRDPGRLPGYDAACTRLSSGWKIVFYRCLSRGSDCVRLFTLSFIMFSQKTAGLFVIKYEIS